MGTITNTLRNRIAQNDGGIQPILFGQVISDFTTVEAPLKLANETVVTYADITARDAATPSSGDFGYVTAEDKYYKYDGSAWAEVEDNVIYGDHVLTTGFAKLESTDLDERALNGTGPEEADSTGAEFKLPFMLPGFDSRNIALARQFTLAQMIFLVKDRNGRVWQLGSETEPARIQMTEAGTKGKSTQAPGFMYEIISDTWPVEYKGAIDTI